MWTSLQGYYIIELICASPMDLLSSINKLGIKVWNVDTHQELVVCFSILRRDFEQVNVVAIRAGGKIRILEKRGVYWKLISLKRRPILVGGVALLMVLAMYLPTRIMFVRVEGNNNLPTNLILEQADKCGIRFWSSREKVRSEKVKNALLDAIPQLQWIGVNTYGCVAVITVEEGENHEENVPSASSRKIVAARDGVIQQMTVIKGNAQCKVGQAVKKGQTLVSGYTDCGIVVKVEFSEAEVLAQTSRDLYAVSPSEVVERCSLAREEVKIFLCIGKNIIKFHKDSGISDASCVKMYREIKLGLPGGFVLPVSLVVSTYSYYDCEFVNVTDSEFPARFANSAESYLHEQMISGRILDKKQNIVADEGLLCLTGRYTCLEMIGHAEDEEFVKINE